jgi:galactose mutarotase-like enzyme
MNDAIFALDPTARTLRGGSLRAVFLPGRGMLGASLQYRGEDLLGRLEDIASFAQSGRACGIPLLHPWANRLGAMRYQASGKEVALDPVPVSFGYHPYIRIPGCPRAEWQVAMPAMSRLRFDERGVPTGEESAFPEFDAILGERAFDDGFALLDPHAFFSILGNGRRITVEFVEGYRYARCSRPAARTISTSSR